MEQAEIVYQDRILEITKRLTEKGNKYKIEMTDGRFTGLGKNILLMTNRL